MRPDGRIDAHRNVAAFGQRLVKRFAHAVQTLKLIVAARAGARQDRRDRLRIMRRELRVESWRLQQFRGA